MTTNTVDKAAKRFVVYCVEMPGPKVTQQVLASLAGITQPTISAIVNGRRVARRSEDMALDALNRLRQEQGLERIDRDEILWTF